jgi:septal ring factor EnvC (AmiA/AmiB activator)
MKYQFLLAGFAVMQLSSCVAMMEAQAQSRGLTGNPNSGGGFGYSQELANQNTDRMRVEQRSAEKQRDATQGQVASLKRQIASLENKLAAERSEAARETINKEIESAQRKLMQLESGT